MKPAEIEGINKDFEEAGHLAPTGLFLGGEKYMVVQGEAGAVIRGKKVIENELEKTLFMILIEEKESKDQSFNFVISKLSSCLLLAGSWWSHYQEDYSSSSLWHL